MDCRSTESLSQPRAITFDVGGTLIEPFPSVGHVYAEAAAACGVRGLDPALLTRRFVAAWQARPKFGYTRAEWAAVVDETFSGLTEPPPSRTFFNRLYDRFAEADAWHVYDDVRPSLEQLAARGVKLGVISNWDDRLQPLLRSLGLADLFQSIVVSCDAPAPKPAPEIFARAAAGLGELPQQILHVGDSLEMDVQGAQAAGFQAVLLRRKAARSEDGVIRSLRELIPARG
jgi:putative hydrolase of the HAD superfamily